MTEDHYFTEAPTSKIIPGKIKATLRGTQYTFHTSSGIFSKKRIDMGTRFLIQKMQIEPDDDILDLGSGYGPLGIVAATLAPEGHTVLTDVNKRAVGLSKSNIKENRLRNAEARKGEFYEPVKGEKFDVILCNLPMSAGLVVVYKIIRESADYLNPGGSLQVVVRKGHPRIGAEMEKLYGNLEIPTR